MLTGDAVIYKKSLGFAACGADFLSRSCDRKRLVASVVDFDVQFHFSLLGEKPPSKECLSILEHLRASRTEKAIVNNFLG